MQASPRLSEPAAMAGSWQLLGPQGGCRLILSVRTVPPSAGSLAAPMLALSADEDCLTQAGVAGWRPIPLGLELDDAEGYAVLTFERTDEGTYRTPDGAWTLTRL